MKLGPWPWACTIWWVECPPWWLSRCCTGLAHRLVWTRMLQGLRAVALTEQDCMCRPAPLLSERTELVHRHSGDVTVMLGRP